MSVKDNQVNSFESGGMNLDLSDLQIGTKDYKLATNATVVDNSSNQFVIRSKKGNTKVAELTSGFIPIGVSEDNDDVAYIVSHNPVTGEGEIGTFPSPQYYTTTTILETTVGSTSSLTSGAPWTDLLKITVTGNSSAFNGTIEFLTSVELGDATLPVFDFTMHNLGVGESRFELITPTVFNDRIGLVVNSGAVTVKLEQVTLNTSGTIVEEYHPLINFFPQRYVDRVNQYSLGGTNDFSVFRTTLLNLDLTKPVKIKTQNSYDDSINLILNDNKNPPRIINNRFTLTGSNTFTRIDRTGVNDTNIYSEGNFNATKLFLSSTVIPNLQFNGVNTGGRLFGGNYKFYFRYADRDGNTTDFIEESLPVSVFDGSNVLDVIGTRGDARTNKKVKFTLSNVDTGYDRVLVYYTFWGNNIPTDSVGVNYLINKDYLIQGASSITIEVNGFESITIVDQAELNPVFINPNTVKDLDVIQNRLFLAGVKSYAFEFDDYVAFANAITVEYNTYKISARGIVSTTELFDGSLNTINQSNGDVLALSTPGYKNYNLGYYNPMNIYHSLGYFGTEAYQVGVCLIEKETGSLIGPFPVKGTDHFASGTNTSGVIRFPERAFISAQTMPLSTESTVYKFNVFGLKFIIDLNDPTYATIKAKTNGMFFVRTKRKPNLLLQGAMVAAAKAKVVEGRYNLNFNKSSDDYSDMSDKYLYPVIGGYLESNLESGDRQLNGCYFYNNAAQDFSSRSSFIDNKRFAFYAPDYRTNPAFYNSEFLTGKDVYYRKLAFINSLIESGFQGTNGGNDVPSLFGSTGFSLSTLDEGKATSALVVPYNTVYNIQRFTSAFADTQTDQALVLEGPAGAGDYHINQRYDSYLSIELDTPPNISFTRGILLNSNNSVSNQIIQDQGTYILTFPYSSRSWGYLVSIYETNPADITITDLYNDITQEQLYQISKRYSWEEFETTFGSSGTVNVPVFGGDCFVNYSYLKVASNWLDQSNPTEDANDIKTGYALAVATENQFNTYLRDENEADVLETITYGTQRSFLPYQTSDFTGASTAIRFANTIRDFKLRIPETDQLNTGHKESTGLKIYSAPDTTVPFVVTNYTNTVFYTPEYIKENFANSFRVVYGLSQQTYNSELGEITSIHSYYNTLLIVFRSGIGIYPVNDRVPIVSEQGNVNIESIGVLAKSGKIISSDYGSKWTMGVLKTPYTIYGLDEELRLWRLEGDKVRLIDEYTVHGFLKKNVNNVKKALEIGKTDIRLYYNSVYKEIDFVFYDNVSNATTNTVVRPAQSFTLSEIEEGNLGITEQNTFNLVYSEVRSQFTGFDTNIPLIGYNVGERFFTHNVYNNQKDIYEHNTGTNYAYWYGQYSDKFIIEFVVNKQSSMNKILDNLHIIGNSTAPESITYNSDRYSNISHNIISRAAGNIRSYNHQYIENQHRIGCVRGTRDRLKDKYHRVRIVYPGGTSYSYIQAIISFFSYMFRG